MMQTNEIKFIQFLSILPYISKTLKKFLFILSHINQLDLEQENIEEKKNESYYKKKTSKDKQLRIFDKIIY